MSQFFHIHPDNPQPRLIKQAAERLRAGDVAVVPTDSAYALVCSLENKNGVERIRQIRRLDDKHNFTLLCRDLSEISTFARITNIEFRLLKSHTPGAYTFILNASREVPRRLMHPKRRTIGIRVPQDNVLSALLGELNEPIMSSSLILPGETLPMTDPWDIESAIGHSVDLIVDGGFRGLEPTTVVDLTGDNPEVVRIGAGDPRIFETQ
ncbi:MAG: L-threonylcarbamoyladenylate synthase [Litorivicinus sp.]